ncbi:coiled-coil domain-containing protein [Nocardia terpenica]|uniref:hypothetical protein n=1 Tax=Nocardia terpenica TaxID=455432 RepID=UPI0012FE10F9|nr:hypothetical protein [Nocardia terpenica]
MGSDDTDRPENLSPSARRQYEDNYVPKKLARGEVPRTPLGWSAANAAFRAQWLTGKAFQLGVGKVFGLEQRGAQQEVVVPTSQGRIVADWRIPEIDMHRAMNIETKSGRSDHERDLIQMRGYGERLEAGEKVVLITRAAADKDLSKEARELRDRLLKMYPGRFIVKAANERVYKRILEAGMRELKKNLAQQVQQSLGKVAEKEARAADRSLAVDSLGREYLRQVQDARTRGQDVPVQELRTVVELLAIMGKVQLENDRKNNQRNITELGQGFHHNKAVEKTLEHQTQERHAERMDPAHQLAHELYDRERALLVTQTNAAIEEINRAYERGQHIDLAKTQEQHLALGNALGAIQASEMALLKDISQGIGEQKGWLQGMAIIQSEKDFALAKGIEAIGAEAAAEEQRRAKEKADLEKTREIMDQAEAQRKAQQRAYEARGMPEMAQHLELMKGVAPPGVELPGAEEAHEVTREGRAAARERERNRGLDKGRER